MEGWLACLTELGILEDNPAWAKVAFAHELPEPLAPYSPMILRNFDEDEYMNRLKEDEDAADAGVPSVNEVAQILDEAGMTTTEEAGVKMQPRILLSSSNVLFCFVQRLFPF